MTTQICSAYWGVLRCKLEPHHEGLHVAKGSGLLWGDAANYAGYFNQADAPTPQERIEEVVEKAKLITVDQAADLVDERDKLLAESTLQKNVIVGLHEENAELKERVGVMEREVEYFIKDRNLYQQYYVEERKRIADLEEKLEACDSTNVDLREENQMLEARNAELEETTTQSSTANDPHFVVRMQLLEELNTALMRIWQLDLRKHQAGQF